ncbi:hypothetical protein L484_003180 [Morus notabilis]|uniref:Uncharacterized protein n=1 Tax=Morus notabilis TaxID=981085 RepID=W9RZG3_9ROSA|nr:hypothetical protein L484_003180 [Morus notabilis]
MAGEEVDWDGNLCWGGGAASRMVKSHGGVLGAPINLHHHRYHATAPLPPESSSPFGVAATNARRHRKAVERRSARRIVWAKMPRESDDLARVAGGATTANLLAKVGGDRLWQQRRDGMMAG